MYNWPLINNNITTGDRQVLSDFILTTDRFTNGPKVREFEKAWSKWLGTDYSTMVNSGASANYISIAIVKELKGIGEIIVPPIGWVSDISSVVQLGMKPVFVDVSLNNFNITTENIRNAITKDTKAIVLVHALGFNALDDELLELIKEKDIILIEDCCESHGATFKDKKIGTYGHMSLFSFYFGHHITTIEGGIISTDDERINELVRLFRSHGMTREASKETQELYKLKYPELNPLFTFAVAGFNMRSTEINAVLGIEQMKRIDSNIAFRRQNLETWLNNLDIDVFITSFDIKGNSNFALPLLLQGKYKNKLDEVCKILEHEGVEYRLGTAGGGNQSLQPYLDKFSWKKLGNLPISNYIHKYSLYVGNHPELTEQQIKNLCKKLNDIKNV